jgi:putative transcriptional regulator
MRTIRRSRRRSEAVAESLRGSLLIAGPQLLDPNFRRTVVLVADHGEEGAMGVILNRPSGMTVADAAPDLEPLIGPDAPIFAGGPVQPTSGVVLAEVAEADEPVFGDVVLVPGLGELADVVDGAGQIRVFAGYAGWGPGQLDGELERDDWILEPARASDVFSDDPEGLWAAVLERKGGQYALVARMPEDPSQN